MSNCVTASKGPAEYLNIYIAGPMTGLPAYNKSAFAAVAANLAHEYHAVLSPHVLPDGMDYRCYMDITMAMVRSCDVIHCLPGWTKSAGACAEIEYARCLGKTITGAES